MDGKELERQFRLGSEVATFKLRMVILAYLEFSGVLDDLQIAEVVGLDLTERDMPDWFRRGRHYAIQSILKEAGK